MCKYHSSCYFNESDNSWNDVNIPYGHALLLESDDLLYSNNFSISYAHLLINTMPQCSRHLRERRNGLCGCLKVFFARTATHGRARESEGTACVVVVSGTRFESLFFFGLHVRPRTYGHARTGMH